LIARWLCAHVGLNGRVRSEEWSSSTAEEWRAWGCASGRMVGLAGSTFQMLLPQSSWLLQLRTVSSFLHSTLPIYPKAKRVASHASLSLASNRRSNVALRGLAKPVVLSRHAIEDAALSGSSDRATPTGPYCVLTCALMDPTTLGSGVSWASSTYGSRLHHVLLHDCRNRVKMLSNAADSLGLQSVKGSGKRSAWLMRVRMAIDGGGEFARSCLTDSPLALSPLQPS
jgi:hypothetical protein